MFTDGDKKYKNKNKSKKSKKNKQSSSTNHEFDDFYKNYRDSSKQDELENNNFVPEEQYEEDYQEDNYNEEEVVEETQVDYDYSDDTNYNEIDAQRKKEKRRKILFIIGIIFFILIILLVVLAIIMSPRIKLNENEMSLKVGESKNISFEVLNTKESIATDFSTMNKDVVIVDEAGKISAVGPGTTDIIVSYKIGRMNKVSKCKVTVVSEKEEDPPKEDPKEPENPTPTNPTPQQPTNPTPQQPTSCDNDPSLNVSLSNAKENEWTNKDVVININASSNCNGTVSLKYGLNCSTSCNYTNVSGNSITISNTGVNTVSVVATDAKNNKTTAKSVIVKIDKTPPKISLMPDANQTNFSPSSSITKQIEVCASCTDLESGCKVTKICKNYSQTLKDQTITGEDNAGNSSSTNKFNVTFN